MTEDKFEKPIHVKPTFYSYCHESLKSIAKEYGYNLVLHGSINRDLDLIAIPWVDEPKDEVEMIRALDFYLRGNIPLKYGFEHEYMFSILPGGRRSYVINLNRGGYVTRGGLEIYEEDKQYYLDISITPIITTN